MSSVPHPWNDEIVLVAGREFHQFSVQHGVYCVPVDENEESRLNEFHSILLSWDKIGRLILPNIGDLELTSVLDCGCGSGIWGDDVSERYEDYDCEVTGVDLFIAREFASKRWNLNAPFRLDNELSRTRYDLINSRFLTSGIDRTRWPAYVRDMFNQLRSGGWLQMTESYMNIQSDSGRREEAPCIGRWWELYSTALEQQEKDPRVGTTVTNPRQRAWLNLKTLMDETGFVETQSEQLRLPIGGWESDPNSREVGNRVLGEMRRTLESLGLWACCRIHGMAEDDFAQLIDGCVREMETPGLRLYLQLFLVWGQKPRRNQGQNKTAKEPVQQSHGVPMGPPSVMKR